MVNSFSQLIKELRENKKLTQTELSQLLEMKTYTTISKWESGENFPKGRDLKRLAELFNVSSDYLLGLTNKKGSDISVASSNLEPKRQEKVLDYATDQLERQKHHQAADEKYMNLFEVQEEHQVKDNDITYIADYIDDYATGLVSAGSGIWQDDYINIDVRFPKDEAPEHYDSIAKVIGQSMEPVIHDGDLLFINNTSQVDYNQIAIFKVNGENFVKKLKLGENNRPYLESLNHDFDNIQLCEDDEIRTIGEVIGIYSA